MKITKAQDKTRDELMARLRDSGTALGAAIEVYNETIKEALEAMNAAIDPYNEAMEAAVTFVESVTGPLREKIDCASDRWLESDKGAAAEAFVSEWEGVSLEPFEFEEAEEIPEFDSSEACTLLEDLPADSEGEV